MATVAPASRPTRATAAFWASWADNTPVLQQREGSFVHGLVHNLHNDGELPPPLVLLEKARASLSAVGFEPPSRHDLIAGQAAPPACNSTPPVDGRVLLFFVASQAVDSFCHRALLRELDASGAAVSFKRRCSEHSSYGGSPSPRPDAAAASRMMHAVTTWPFAHAPALKLLLLAPRMRLARFRPQSAELLGWAEALEARSHDAPPFDENI